MFNLFKKSKKTKSPSPATSSIDKDKIFKHSIIKLYQDQEYCVWDHSDDECSEDTNITIVVKKNKEIILIQCYPWTTNISLKDIKEFEQERDKFILKNPIFSDYNIKLRYTLTGFFLNENAFWYIQEQAKLISYEIVKSN